MATVVKNFRIKSGLIVEGTTGTINSQNILTETGGDNYILNLVGGATLVKSVDTNVFNVDGAGKLTVNANTFDSYGSASAAQTAAATDATNKANQALADAQTYANSLASNYDAAGSASAAQTAAQSYADTVAGTAEQNAKDYADSLTTSDIAEGTNLYFTEQRAQNSISASDPISYSQGYIGLNIDSSGGLNTNQGYLAIDRQIVDGWYDAAGAATTAENNAKAYTDQEVSALVDSAPALLDTLNELAAAIADNPNYATDVANLIAGKQDTLTAGSNIDITQNTISVTGLDTDDVAEGPSRLYFTNTRAQDAIGAGTGLTKDNQGTELAINRQAVDTWYDAAGSAATAQSNAEGYADNLTNNMLDGTTPFTDLNINDVAKQIAARTTSLGSVAVTAYQFNKSAFKSGKFLVKIDNGTHNEISEILVTLDSSDNVAITEYAIVGTNGSRGTITADVDATHCRIRVNPVNDSTITVAGTIFNS